MTMDEKRDRATHVTFEQLLDYLELRLQPEEIRRVEAHLATNCPGCHADLNWLRETLNLLVSKPWFDPPVHLSTAARQMYRRRNPATISGRVPAARPEPSLSFGQWLRSLIPAIPRPALAFAAILILVLIGAVIFQLWPNPAVQQQAMADAVTGTVESRTAEGVAWVSVPEDIPLKSGASVRTGHDSSVTLAFDDESVTFLDSETEVTIVEMSSNSDGSEQVIILRQNIGRTVNRVQPLPSGNKRFEIHTPSATVRVRGTEFTVDVAAGGQTVVEVAQGSVDVIANGVTIAVTAGQSTTVLPGVRPATAEVLVQTPDLSVLGTPSPGKGNGLKDRGGAETRAGDGASVEATATPTPSTAATRIATLTASPTPTEPPPPQPSSTPTEPPPPQPSSTPTEPPPPPPTATATEPPPPPTATPTSEKKTPPGHTNTPQPPGQSRTPEAPGLSNNRNSRSRGK